MDINFTEPLTIVLILYLISCFSIFWTDNGMKGLLMSYSALFTIYLLDTFTLLENLTSFSTLFTKPNPYSLIICSVLLGVSGALTRKVTIGIWTIFSISMISLVIIDPSIFIGFLYGLLIFFSAYRTTGWITQAPDYLILGLSIAFPLSLFAINTSELSFMTAGVMLGLGIGRYIEKLKVKMTYSRDLIHRFAALLIGLCGTTLLFVSTIYLASILSVLVGLWVTLFAPYLFVKTSLYPAHSFQFHSKPSVEH